MRDWLNYAKKQGIILQEIGPCQFCGSLVSGGVMECHNNTNHISEILDFNDPENYAARFLSVDAMALQHCELHGPWNNHIHVARLLLVFEKGIRWHYGLTPLLSNIVNEYKRNRSDALEPPPVRQRGTITTMDVMAAQTKEQCRQKVNDWAFAVLQAFKMHHKEVGIIVSRFQEKYR